MMRKNYFNFFEKSVTSNGTNGSSTAAHALKVDFFCQ